MDLEKLVKFAGTYLRAYVQSFVGLFAPSSMMPGEANAVGDTTEDQKWVFLILSFVIGYPAYSIATGHDLKIADIPVVSIFFTLWMWLLFAIFTHVLMRLIGGSGGFADTLDVCVRIMPAVYVISAMCALTTRIFFGDQIGRLGISLIFLSVQFALLSFLLPSALRPIHKISGARQAAVTALLPVVVLVVNVLSVALPALLAWSSIASFFDALTKGLGGGGAHFT
jgi:hypothetical protein